jgi:hypothetical protein
MTPAVLEDLIDKVENKVENPDMDHVGATIAARESASTA